MKKESFVTGTVKTVGIKNDVHAYFVTGSDSRSYFGRQKNRKVKLNVGDFVVFLAEETRIIDKSVNLIEEDSSILFSQSFNVFEALSPKWLKLIFSRAQKPLLKIWWENRLTLAEHPSVELAKVLADFVPPKSLSDPLYFWSPESAPTTAQISTKEKQEILEILEHRLSNNYQCPPVEEFSFDIVRMLLKRFPSFPRAESVAQTHLNRLSNHESHEFLEEVIESDNPKVRQTGITWAKNQPIPIENKGFVYTDSDYFYRTLRQLPLHERKPKLTVRLTVFPAEKGLLLGEEKWLLTEPLNVWFRTSESVHEYLLQASEFASLEEIIALLPHLYSIPSVLRANTFNSDTDLAIKRIGERYRQSNQIPEWMKSYVVPEHTWNSLTNQQKMYLIIREHAQQSTVSTVPTDLRNEDPLIRALIHFCNLAKTKGLQTPDSIEILQLLRERLEANWTDQSSKGVKIDNSPLLPKCTKPRVSDEVTHCEGRLNLEKLDLQEEGKSSWVPVSPWECRCPRTSTNCDEWNNLIPNLEKPWWRWSVNELINQAGANYKLIGSRFIEDEKVGVIFINRLAGVANRVNELTERLKCRNCSQRLTYKMTYARNPARYMTTTTEPCSTGGSKCDGSVYINHCLGCREIIDSRDSPFKIDGLYNCIHCATASSVALAGEYCPNCGDRETLSGIGQDQTCRKCGHRVRLPLGATKVRRQQTRWR